MHGKLDHDYGERKRVIVCLVGERIPIYLKVDNTIQDPRPRAVTVDCVDGVNSIDIDRTVHSAEP